MEFKRALRGLKRSPGFAMGVILLLGIATAGLLTVSTAVYTLFFQPLPYHDAGQLVRLSTLMRAMGNVETGLSAPMLVELQQDPALTDIAAYQNAESVVDDSGMTWRRARLTHNLFDVFGVQPLLGRNFVAEDGAPGAALAALVSERVWRQRLGGQADVLERNISLEGKPVKIVGVLPDAVAIPSRSTELWLPLQFTPEQLSPSSILTFGREFDGVVARLAPGVAAKAFQDRLRARYMEDERLAPAIEFSGLEFRVKSLQESWTDKYRAPLSILSFAVAMLLLATVLNLAGMWVLRMLDRSHGQALQAALGASRWQNMASIITEYAVLGAAGVTLAVMLTPLGVSWLGALNILDANLPITVGVGPATVLLALAVLLLGALPVVVGAWWQARRQQFHAALQLASGGASARSGPGASRKILVIVQIALAMSLLAGVALLLLSWYGLLNEDLGFEPKQLLVANIQAPPNAVQSDEIPGDANVEAALERLRTLPGVDTLSYANSVPFGLTDIITSITLTDRPDMQTRVRSQEVGENYFRVAGIDLIQGRGFAPADAGTQVAIVDEWFANKYFPQDAAVGRRFRSEGDEDVEIIGVVRTAKHWSSEKTTEVGTQYRFLTRPKAEVFVMIAATVPAHTLIDPVRHVLRELLGPERVTVGSVVTMQSLIRRSVEDREPQLILLGMFAALTLLLAAIGLYALLSHSVRVRTAEYGLRMALGAQAGDIRRQVLHGILRLLFPGLLLGVAGAYLVGRLVAERLYNLHPASPLIWLAVGALVALVVLFSGLWPAIRAAHTSPMEALRYE